MKTINGGNQTLDLTIQELRPSGFRSEWAKHLSTGYNHWFKAKYVDLSCLMRYS
nr:hypothetical protein [Mycoplasmopsis bovis]